MTTLKAAVWLICAASGAAAAAAAAVAAGSVMLMSIGGSLKHVVLLDHFFEVMTIMPASGGICFGSEFD
jgi:hypothetical protein